MFIFIGIEVKCKFEENNNGKILWPSKRIFLDLIEKFKIFLKKIAKYSELSIVSMAYLCITFSNLQNYLFY